MNWLELCVNKVKGKSVSGGNYDSIVKINFSKGCFIKLPKVFLGYIGYF